MRLTTIAPFHLHCGAKLLNLSNPRVNSTAGSPAPNAILHLPRMRGTISEMECLSQAPTGIEPYGWSQERESGALHGTAALAGKWLSCSSLFAAGSDASLKIA